MNASRVFSIFVKEKGMNDVFSAGRVQTPTLALIVKREKEIENFKSEPFWEVFATFNIEGKKYEGKWEKDSESRLKDPDMANKIAAFCQGKPAVVKEMKTGVKNFSLRFYLTYHHYKQRQIKHLNSHRKTLDITQALYQKELSLILVQIPTMLHKVKRQHSLIFYRS